MSRIPAMSITQHYYRFRCVSGASLIAVSLMVAPIEVAQGQQPTTEFESGTIDIGVVVSDLPASLAFYQDVLGMKKVGAFNLDADAGRRTGLSGGTPFSVVVLKLKDGESSTSWKLTTFDGVETGAQGGHIQDGVGMRYVTVFVRDMSPFLDRIEQHGVAFLGETPIMLDDGRQFVLVQDPDGLFIELIAPAPE